MNPMNQIKDLLPKGAQTIASTQRKKAFDTGRFYSKTIFLVKSFSGSTINNMYDFSRPSLEKEPDLVILHIGVNNIRSEKSPKEIATDILELADNMRTNDIKVVISQLI